MPEMWENGEQIMEKEISKIDFIPNGNDDDWVMRIQRLHPEGSPQIMFNTDRYPNCMEGDFAKAVCEILKQTGCLDSFIKGSEC